MINTDGRLFAVLDIEPTLDPVAIKRGYFKELQKHAPHTDPAGFRRLREVYERLLDRDEILAAYMSCLPPVDAAWSGLEASIGEEIGRVAEKHALQIHDSTAKKAVMDAVSRLTLPDALKAFSRA